MISALDGMCQDRLSKEPSQEDSPARSPTAHTGTGSGDVGRITAACLLPPASPPSKSDLKEPTCLDLLEKRKLIQQNIDFPQLPFLWEFTQCGKCGLKALC